MDEPASIDSLTGAYDRRSFAAGFAAALERSRADGSPMTLAVIDLDHFKSINDAFGHARGDQILREAAQRMLHTLRATDRLYRYGGDEFVLILQDAGLEQAQALVERLMNAVRDEKMAGNPPVRMTLSIGAASSDEIRDANADEIDAQALFERADARLYLSKRQGRNRLHMRDAVAEAATDGERHGGRMLEREKALADIRAFLDALPGCKRARLRVAGAAGSGRSRVLAEAGRHAALRGYEVMSLQGRTGFALRTHATILEARAAGGLWSELPHPQGGAPELVPALASALAARGAAGLVLLADGAEEIDRSTQALLRAIVACGDIEQVALVACADGALPQSLDCGLDQETPLAALTPEGTGLWLRSMLMWEPPAEFVSAFHDSCEGLPGVMARRLRRLCDLNLLTPGAESWNLERNWRAALDADTRNSARGARNTPLPEEELIGREQELALIKQAFKSGGLSTIIAPGGMGKTRLALQVAVELTGEFADGIHWVSLTGIESSELMLPALLQAFNVRLQGGVAPRRILIERCRKSSMLLILDGFDPMMHDLGLIEEIAHASPNLRLLVTSREELHLPAERVLHLQGLDVGTGSANGDGSPTLGHAETLFLQQARKALAEFAPAMDDLPHISRICASVGGLPLAIRLAAAWVTVFNCAEIAGKLEKDPQQANALSVINYFWSQLSESERQGARALAVCRGGFELSAAQKVAQVSPFFLSALVTKSFLVRNHGGRYDMQELLRQYSQRELSARPQDWSKLRLVHGEYYLELVEQAAARWHGGDEVFWFARLTIELDNLRAALAAAIEDRRVGEALRMVAALANFWIGRGLILEGLRWTDLVLRQDGVDADAHRAPAVAAQGKLYFWSGQPEQSVRAFELGLCLAEQAGLTVTMAVCQAWLAASLFRRGRHADALPLGERALAVAREASLPGEHALCLLTLGGILLERGDQAGARVHLMQCLRMFEEQGDGRRRTIALIFLGMLEYRDGLLDEAKRNFIEAISASLDNDDRLNYAFGMAHLGAVEVAQGYRRDAHRRFAEAREILHQAGAYDWEALCLVHAAQAHLGVQDCAAARLALDTALTCALDSRSVRRQLLVVAAFAQLAAAEDDANRARELANLVLAHPDRGAEASIPARAALDACGSAVGDEVSMNLAECLAELKGHAEAAAKA